MDDRRHLAIIGDLQCGFDAQRTFLERPINPHRYAVGNRVGLGVANANFHRQFQHLPKTAHPRACCNDGVVTLDATLVGIDCLNCATVVGLQRLDGNATDDSHAQRFGLAGQAVHGSRVICVAARHFMQDRGNALSPPVREQVFHVALAFRCTLNKNRFVADGLLLCVNRCHIVSHRFTADLHVSHGMVAICIGVALPYIHRVSHEFPHSRLKIVIANHTACYARRA